MDNAQVLKLLEDINKSVFSKCSFKDVGGDDIVAIYSCFHRAGDMIRKLKEPPKEDVVKIDGSRSVNKRKK